MIGYCARCHQPWPESKLGALEDAIGRYCPPCRVAVRAYRTAKRGHR